MTKEQYFHQIDRASAFASGRPNEWSMMFMLALDLYGLKLVYDVPNHEEEEWLDVMAPVPAPTDENPHRYPAWIVRKRQ